LYTGLTALALFTPQGLCAPIGGLLADRYDRRKVFAWALFGQAVATSALAIVLAMGQRNPLLLSAIIVFTSAGGALGQPAYSAMLPDLVPPEELMAMVSLGIYSWNGGRILGPILGTLLVGVFGPAWTVFFNAATFGVMAFAVSLLRRSFVPPGSEHERIRERLVEGWHAMRRVAGCRYGIIIIMALNLSVGPFMGLIPIYARIVFHGGTGLAGTFSALQGTGAIVGSLAITVLAVRAGRGRLVIWAVMSLGVAYVVYALAPNAAVAGAAIVFMGGGAAALFVCGMAIVQRDAPAGERGRILSICQCAMGLCYGIGMVWIALVGDLVNLRVAFLAACGVAMLGTLILTRSDRTWQTVVNGNDATMHLPPVIDTSHHIAAGAAAS